MSAYDNIMETKWPQESGRQRMSLSQRAKIFLPFAALTGFDAAIEETLKAEIERVERRRPSLENRRR